MIWLAFGAFSCPGPDQARNFLKTIERSRHKHNLCLLLTTVPDVDPRHSHRHPASVRQEVIVLKPADYDGPICIYPFPSKQSQR